MRLRSASAERVAANTSEPVNEEIRKETEASIEYYRQHPAGIDLRLEDLDREWDIERVLETGSSLLSLTGLGLGIGVNRKWLLLTVVVQGFFLQHALQGWCPPIPVLRRLGFRTAKEIEGERHALLAMRGDGGGVEQKRSGSRRRVSGLEPAEAQP